MVGVSGRPGRRSNGTSRKSVAEAKEFNSEIKGD